MRQPRLDFPGARHHVMNRGARRQAVFVDADERDLFVALLAELPERFRVRVHAYALMPNHYHLMVESTTGELSRAMRHLGGEYSRRLNVLRGWDGPVFRGRFRNRVVGSEAYWQHLLLYVHLNPVRAGLATLDGPAWTSHRAYLDPATRPAWLCTDELLALCGGAAGYAELVRAEHAGLRPRPADFDPKRLWAPDPTGAVAGWGGQFAGPTLAEALKDVSEVTGVAIEDVLASKRGRDGNPVKWLAAWWMTRKCAMGNGAVGAVLGASHPMLSKWVARFEARRHDTPEWSTWVAALESRQKTVNG